jgi:hypothetical protein
MKQTTKKSELQPQTKYGLPISDVQVLLSSARKISISEASVASLVAKYPKLTANEAVEILKILRSPCRNTFTAYDITAYIKSL